MKRIFLFLLCLQALPLLSQDLVMETGQVSIDHNEVEVNFNNQFVDPVVIALPPSLEGNDEASVRLRHITPDGFKIYLEEPSGRDGGHKVEVVHYIVVEKGTYEFPRGIQLEAGTIAPTSQLNFQSVSFQGSFDTTPVVITQVQSAENATDFLTTRQQNSSTTGFDVKLEREESLNGTNLNAADTIGYFAITPGKGQFDDIDFEAGTFSVSSALGTFPFASNFDPGLHFVGSVGTYNNGDPVTLRWNTLDTNAVALRLKEDISIPGTGVFHPVETVNFFAINDNGGQGIYLPELVMETGQVLVDHNITTVSLQNEFVDPVVIALPPQRNGSHPVSVRLQNISSNQFQIFFEEPNGLDGIHTFEIVHYVVVEKGSHEINGVKLEAGLLPASNDFNWKTTSFTPGFSQTPILLSQLQTSNNPDEFLITRQQSASSTGFQVKMEGEENFNSSTLLNPETIGYLAISPGYGTLDGASFEANSFSADESNTTHDYVQPFPNTDYHFVSAIATTTNTEPVTMRWRRLQPDHAEVFLQEDTTLDPETAHGTETVDYFVIDTYADQGVFFWGAPTVPRIGQFDAETPEETQADHSTVALKLSEAARDFRVYPVPSNSLLHIDGVQPESVRIFDLAGKALDRELRVIAQDDSSMSIDISNWAAGVYLLKSAQGQKLFVKE